MHYTCFNRRFFVPLTLGLWLIAPWASRSAAAFPLDPVRIYFADTSPAAGEVEVEVSVWQGGTPQKQDDGRELYRERRTITTDREGRYDYWLGEGRVLNGELRGREFDLDKELRLQIRYIRMTEQSTKRMVLLPIDNAYIARFPRSRQPGENEHLRGVYYKDYEPSFDRFSADLVRRGMAILYPDGRLQTEDGSFVDTSSTRTSGVQEFFDYCADHHVDGYIVGGSRPRHQQITYRIWKPLRMHPAQGIRIDTGAICLQFMPEVGDATGLTIDSCMMNDIRLRGLLHYMGKGYALAVKPENPLPLDRFVGNTVVDTAVYVTSVACSEAKGAVLFDGSINFSRFEFNELNHGSVGIHVTPESSFSNNRLTCKHVHGQTGTSVLDEGGAANVWEVNLNCDGKDPRGIVTSGIDSLWFANVISRAQPGLVLEKNARGNQFFLLGLSGGFLNHAQQPTNRFYASPSIDAKRLGLGYAVETPEVPQSDLAATNANPFPVVVLIKQPGGVTRWSLTDSYGEVDSFPGPLVAGHNIYLAPGEAISLRYTGERPRWRWRAVQ